MPQFIAYIFEKVEKRHTLLLVLFFSIIHTLLYWKFGVQTDFEAKKYISQAHYFLENGTLETKNFWLYSTQIFLIAFSIKLKLGLGFVLIIQLLLSLLSIIAFYEIGKIVSTSKNSLIITIIFLFNIPFFSYNFSLQTESIFHSCTIIYLYFLIRPLKNEQNRILICFTLLFFLCITRPMGSYFIIPTLFFFLFKAFNKLHLRKGIFIKMFLSLTFLLILNYLMGLGGEFDFLLPFKAKMVICGVPELEIAWNAKNESSWPLVELFQFIFTHPLLFAEMAIKKTISFWGLWRNYYSLPHNILLSIYFFPTIIISIISVKKWISLNRKFFFFCFTVIFITWGAVIFSCDDWHNRFFLGITPYLFLLCLPPKNSLLN